MTERINTPFTNEHFAAFCEKMVGQPYWMGCCGYKATKSLLSRKAKQYPSHYGANRMARYRQDIARKAVVCDCIGAAKGYAWSGGGQAILDAVGSKGAVKNRYGSNSCPDKGADSMFAYAKKQGAKWGTMDTLPQIVGVALHKSDHVGYTVGNGYAVEWKGFASGCVKTEVQGRGWTHWYCLPFIQYDMNPVAAEVMDDAGTEEILPTDEPEIPQGVEASTAADEHAEGAAADTASQGTVAKTAPSAAIRIRMTKPENIAVYGAEEISLDIEEYLRGVVPCEMYESADIEALKALKAQAVCARTYAFRRRNTVLSDTTTHQAFSVGKIGNCPRSDATISATRGMVLTFAGKVIDCFFSASNDGMTKRSGDVWSTHYPYYVNKADVWDDAARVERNLARSGHGVGLSQLGAMWAARNGVSFTSILAFYYEGCQVTGNYGNR